jgi:hypothetical protein
LNIIGLNGKAYKLNWKKCKRRAQRAKSTPQLVAISLLLEILPGQPIYEEVTLPGLYKMAYCDIFLPGIPMIVEVHGKQHYEFVKFFHKDKHHFLSAQKADRDKEEWCKLNNITYVALPYNKEETWRDLINSAISQD